MARSALELALMHLSRYSIGGSYFLPGPRIGLVLEFCARDLGLKAGTRALCSSGR